LPNTIVVDVNLPNLAASADAYTASISLYLANEAIHADVEAVVDAFLATADLRVEGRGQPIIGSWFRTMRASARQAVHSLATREAALTVAHVADARLVLAQDATITATLLQNLGPVIASLQPTKDAVLRVGALLIVKVEWVVQVFQLTAAQQALLDHQPRLVSSPHEIIKALELSDPAVDYPAVEPDRTGDRT
jgi:hypothetical protein